MARMKIKLLVIILTVIILFFSSISCSKNIRAVSNADAEIYFKVDSILDLMTLEEKAGQMLNIGLPALLEGAYFESRDTLVFNDEKVARLLVKYGAGSVQNMGLYPLTTEDWRTYIRYIQGVVKQETRLKIPLLYGIDGVHGANYTVGSVMTPQQINLAATFNTECARQTGVLTAYELKASAIPWNYSPVLDVARHQQWGRIFESFGEDTYLVSEMGIAMIDGLQGVNTADYDKTVDFTKYKTFEFYGWANESDQVLNGLSF